ncbi:NPCBM/NEW2 domain-containing protein [Pseudonocardia saturnea]
MLVAAAVVTALGACTIPSGGAPDSQGAPNPSNDTSPSSAAAGDSAAPAVTAYLVDLRGLADVVDDSGTVRINGISHPQSLGATFCPPLDNRTWEYDLGRGYRTFSATIGLADDSNSRGMVRYEVFGDDRLLFSQDVGFGTSVDMEVSVTGVLRLRLVSTPLAEPGCAGSEPWWGEARVTGLPGEVPPPE